MTEHKTLTETELCHRWGCSPRDLEFAVDTRIIPDPDNGAWKLTDIEAAEANNFNRPNLPDRISRLAYYKDHADGAIFRTEAQQVLSDLVCEYAGTPGFREAMEIYRQATGESKA